MSPERLAALDALTDADTMAIGVALNNVIREYKHEIALGGDAEFWQPHLDAAKSALNRIMDIRTAS